MKYWTNSTLSTADLDLTIKENTSITAISVRDYGENWQQKGALARKSVFLHDGENTLDPNQDTLELIKTNISDFFIG